MIRTASSPGEQTGPPPRTGCQMTDGIRVDIPVERRSDYFAAALGLLTSRRSLLLIGGLHLADRRENGGCLTASQPGSGLVPVTEQGVEDATTSQPGSAGNCRVPSSVPWV
jgi:hypothetical protein